MNSCSSLDTFYFHHDGLGSTIALTDSTGNVVESYTYDVYGQPSILSTTYQLLPTSSVTNRFLFTGRDHLAELALYDYHHRFYSPSLGRFLQTDPLRFDAEDVNLYRYCDNNSLNYTDFIGADIYYSSSGGVHADLISDDPRSTTGQTFYDFGPQSGDRDNWTWNQLYGPSKISLVSWRGKIPDSYIRIPTTHKQDAAAILMASLSEGRPYSVAFNNCAHMARLIIRSAGIPIRTRIFDTPNKLRDDIQDYLRQKAIEEYLSRRYDILDKLNRDCE